MSTLLPATKREALAAGSKTYFTGKPCKHGHVTLRSLDGRCRECLLILNRSIKTHNKESLNRERRESYAHLPEHTKEVLTAQQRSRAKANYVTKGRATGWSGIPLDQLPKTRADAIAVGAKRYFDGTRCKYGHVSARQPQKKGGACCECAKIYYHEKKTGVKVRQLYVPPPPPPPEIPFVYILLEGVPIASVMESGRFYCDNPLPNLFSANYARKMGLTRYNTGKLCQNGHSSDRTSSQNKCIACDNEKQRKQTSKKYSYGEKPCPICLLIKPFDDFGSRRKNGKPPRWDKVCGDCLEKQRVLRVKVIREDKIRQGSLTPRKIFDPNSGTKFCPKCQKNRETHQFGLDPSKSHGLTSYCKGCRENRKKEYPMKHVAQACRHRARKAGIPCTITPEYLESIWPEDSLCGCGCGVPMIWPGIETRTSPNRMNTGSIDKVLPESGYIESNVIWLRMTCNTQKNNGTGLDHLRFALLIAKHTPKIDLYIIHQIENLIEYCV